MPHESTGGDSRSDQVELVAQRAMQNGAVGGNLRARHERTGDAGSMVGVVGSIRSSSRRVLGAGPGVARPSSTVRPRSRSTVADVAIEHLVGELGRRDPGCAQDAPGEWRCRASRCVEHLVTVGAIDLPSRPIAPAASVLVRDSPRAAITGPTACRSPARTASIAAARTPGSGSTSRCAPAARSLVSSAPSAVRTGRGHWIGDAPSALACPGAAGRPTGRPNRRGARVPRV